MEPKYLLPVKMKWRNEIKCMSSYTICKMGHSSDRDDLTDNKYNCILMNGRILFNIIVRGLMLTS